MLVHPRPACEIDVILARAVQHDDKRRVTACAGDRWVQAVTKRARLALEYRIDESIASRGDALPTLWPCVRAPTAGRAPASARARSLAPSE